MNSQALEGGFSESPVQSAESFRKIMNVMAKPGLIETLDVAAPPAPLSKAAGTLLLTLCDSQTPVYLCGDWDVQPVRDWITFHCNAPLVGAAECMFALGGWNDLKPLQDYPIGTSEYPDRSATLIVEMDHLSNKGCALKGPGIKDVGHLSLPETAFFQDNAGFFPLGLDFYFTCGDKIAALPRTTKVSTIEEGASCM